MNQRWEQILESPRSRASRLFVVSLVAVSNVGSCCATARADESTPPPSIERRPPLQWDVGLATGICVEDGPKSSFDQIHWCSAARADALFGRQRERSVGWGPALSASTVSFDDVRVGLGGSVLLPVWQSVPLVLTAGPLLELGDDDSPAAGVEGWVFLGPRSYNFHGTYNLAHGLLLGTQRTFGDAGSTTIWAMAQVDAVWLTMPVFFLMGL